MINSVYNGSAATQIILDNRITAMTGRQENPTSGYMLNELETYRVDMEQLCRSVGVEHVKVIDPYDIKLTRKTVREEMARPETSVIITTRPCMLVPRDNMDKRMPLYVDHDKCTGCTACSKACPSTSCGSSWILMSICSEVMPSAVPSLVRPNARSMSISGTGVVPGSAPPWR